MRFFIGTPAALELARIALDQANGYRDNLGAPVRVMHKIFQNGVQVGEIASDEYCALHGVQPTDTVGAPFVGEDGTAALELPVVAEVEQHLGKTVRGFALPTAGALVTEAALSGDVARIVDDRLVAVLPEEVTVASLDARPGLSADARARLLALEANIGVGRVRSAVQRRSNAQAQRALEAAMGLGRGGR